MDIGTKKKGVSQAHIHVGLLQTIIIIILLLLLLLILLLIDLNDIKTVYFLKKISNRLYTLSVFIFFFLSFYLFFL